MRGSRSFAVRLVGLLGVACLVLSGCDMEDVANMVGGRSVVEERLGSAADNTRPADTDDEPDIDAVAGDADARADTAPDELDGEPDPVGDDGGVTLIGECDATVTSGTDRVDPGRYPNVRPGDTVCLTAGTRGPLEIVGMAGSAQAPLTFVNEGGTVSIVGDGGDYSGIQVENSEYIRVSGGGVGGACGTAVRGDVQRCGIQVRGTSRSVTGTVRTDNITIDHVEMSGGSRAAVMIKDDDLRRGEWVAKNIVLRDSYVHDTGKEGAYIGSSYYESGSEHLVRGVEVARNLVVNTGWDGLQVGSATQNCAIHDNIVLRAARANESSQRAGIMNNKGSVCDIFNNTIVDSNGWGVYVQGNGSNEIYNNVVVRSGRGVSSGDGDGDGISVHDGSNVNGSIYVWNNTVVSARGDGISWSNDVGSDNQIRNNIAVDSGGRNIDEGSNVRVTNNYTSGDVSDAAFADAAAGDYHLRRGSPAQDAGIPVNDSDVRLDMDGVSRPQGASFDAGAYEVPSG